MERLKENKFLKDYDINHFFNNYTKKQEIRVRFIPETDVEAKRRRERSLQKNNRFKKN